jgi:WD40 repeat protein
MKLAEVDLFAISTLVHSQVPAPEQRLDQQLLQIENLRACVRLSATSLPSVAAYTFLNASSTVTCISISADGSLIATGGADGVIRLWNMRDPRAQMEFEQLQQHDQAHHSEVPSLSLCLCYARIAVLFMCEIYSIRTPNRTPWRWTRAASRGRPRAARFRCRTRA